MFHPHVPPGPAEDPVGGELPPHAKSLGRIPVPATVTLAHKRLRLEEVLNLAPGRVIVFAKPHRQPLELKAAGKTIALGRAVHAGNQLALEITALASDS